MYYALCIIVACILCIILCINILILLRPFKTCNSYFLKNSIKKMQQCKLRLGHGREPCALAILTEEEERKKKGYQHIVGIGSKSSALY